MKFGDDWDDGNGEEAGDSGESEESSTYDSKSSYLVSVSWSINAKDFT